MPRSRLTLLVLLYLVLDFTNPHMPGAVSFDPDESIDGVRVERDRQAWSSRGVVPSPLPVHLMPILASRDTAPRVAPTPGRRWRRDCVRRMRRPDSRPSSPADH
jgi:hypothetical protein